MLQSITFSGPNFDSEANSLAGEKWRVPSIMSTRKKGLSSPFNIISFRVRSHGAGPNCDVGCLRCHILHCTRCTPLYGIHTHRKALTYPGSPYLHNSHAWPSLASSLFSNPSRISASDLLAHFSTVRAGKIVYFFLHIWPVLPSYALVTIMYTYCIDDGCSLRVYTQCPLPFRP